MTSHAASAVCSTAAYQNFLPLAGFPPAQGWCSTVSLLSKRSEQNSANALAPQDVPCPLGSKLCTLLADLKTADREFARGVWYGILLNIGTFRGKERPLTRFSSCCIGVCVGDEPTVRCLLRPQSTRGLIELSQAIITVPGTTTTTPIPTLSQTSSGSMTYIQRHSSASLSPFSSWTLTYIQRHSSDPLEPTPSVSTSSTPSSASATCSSVVGSTSGESVTYNEYYSGTGYVENTNNPGT